MDEIEKLLTDTLAAEVRKLKAEVKRLRREKDARVYYQNIVYAVCRAIDEIDGAKPGTGIVCGTLETPSDQVPRRMQALVDEVRRYKPEGVFIPIKRIRIPDTPGRKVRGDESDLEE